MKDNLKEKYHEMYHKHLVEGKDPKVMILWGKHEKKMVNGIIEKYPEVAESYIDGMEAAICAIGWNNYLTRKEAEHIMANMSPKAKWSIEEVENACKSLGVAYENKPYFNLCALSVTMNMQVSDHEKSISQMFSDETKMVKFVYQWSVEDLMDKDKPEFIRPYYNL